MLTEIDFSPANFSPPSVSQFFRLTVRWSPPLIFRATSEVLKRPRWMTGGREVSHFWWKDWNEDFSEMIIIMIIIIIKEARVLSELIILIHSSFLFFRTIYYRRKKGDAAHSASLSQSWLKKQITKDECKSVRTAFELLT